jgi:hypothetical protein
VRGAVLLSPKKPFHHHCDGETAFLTEGRKRKNNANIINMNKTIDF